MCFDSLVVVLPACCPVFRVCCWKCCCMCSMFCGAHESRVLAGAQTVDLPSTLYLCHLWQCTIWCAAECSNKWLAIGRQTLIPTRRILLLCLLLFPSWDQSAPPPVVPLAGPGPRRCSLTTTVDVHALTYIYAGTQGGPADNFYIFSAYVRS